MNKLLAGFVFFFLAGYMSRGCAVPDGGACASPPLNDDEVSAIAKRALGGEFASPRGMPERPSRVHAVGCRYYFEYVVLSHGGEWFSLDGIDVTEALEVTRDGLVYKAGRLIYSEASRK